MKMTNELLDKVYAKTDGRCHLCHRRIVRSHHGQTDVLTGWHVDHSKARSVGGTDHLNNLFPACWECNLRKQALPSHIIRRRNGVSGIPQSRARKEQESDWDSAIGWILGAITVGVVIAAVKSESVHPGYQ